MNAEHFDCSTCEYKNCDETREAKFERWVIPELDYRSRICPLPSITPLSSQFIKLFKFYRQGILATSNGVLEQPNKYLEAMELIESYVNKISVRN